MTIKIGQASIDENGKARGGAVGDQTGKEIKTSQWYSFPWNVYIECPNKAMAEKAASFMEQICADDNFGYDQSQRETGYYAIVKNGNKVNGAVGEFDCSSLVSSCYKFAGLDINVGNTTATLRSTLLAKDFKVYTDDMHVKSCQFAKRGGIFLCETHHVVMALENGSYEGKLTIGSTGREVKFVQSQLNKTGNSLVVDGDFGIITSNAVKLFQSKNGLLVDGIVGRNTMSAIEAVA